jgi:hypothetical protein
MARYAICLLVDTRTKHRVQIEVEPEDVAAAQAKIEYECDTSGACMDAGGSGADQPFDATDPAGTVLYTLTASYCVIVAQLQHQVNAYDVYSGVLTGQSFGEWA